MKIVVCDTGPIIHLHEAEALQLLERAGKVFIPPAVNNELQGHLPSWSSGRPAWLRIQPVPSSSLPQVERWREVGGLGPGEAEAIILAQALSADWVLTDDAAARVIASLLGLEVHGSLGVVLWGAAMGFLDRGEAFSVFERLKNSSLWISSGLIEESRRALEQLFEQ